MIKLDLKSGLFQFKIRDDHQVLWYLHKQREVRMDKTTNGSPVGPFSDAEIRARNCPINTSEIRHLNGSYLDDWLFFAPNLPAQQVIQFIMELGITINYENSAIEPVSVLTYLGLNINSQLRHITITPPCF
jgi:hypothetical protein